MNINATLINLYIVCPRECWLHANGINMEHTSDLVYDGKLLHETSYPRRAEGFSEIELSAKWEDIELHGKIDFYDAKSKIIHETKRSNKVDTAHECQVKFYIWLFALNGIEGVSGKLEYPKLRKVDKVFLTETDRKYLQEIILKIKNLLNDEKCPPVIKARICKSCSYYDFCYAGEEELKPV